MTTSQLKYLIREEYRKIRENSPTPTKPTKEPTIKPGTPEKPKKRRPLTPPKESPTTNPKAEGKVNENSKQILNKIVQRFKSRK